MNDEFKNSGEFKLYHASAQRREIIHPNHNITMAGDHGSFVFATDRMDMAAAAIALKTPNVLAAGDFPDHTPRIFIRDPREYLNGFSGGFIHAVPTDGFMIVKQSCIATSEWISTKAVEPISSFHITSPSHALRLGVQIYSVAEEYPSARFALDWDEGYITVDAIEKDPLIKCETSMLCRHFGIKHPEV